MPDPDNDVAALAAQLLDIANGRLDLSPELRHRFVVLADSVAALGRALAVDSDDPATRAGLADELDRARAAVVQVVGVTGATIPAKVAEQLRGASIAGLVDLLAYVASWLRNPTPETTAAVERFVAALRTMPGAEALWTDRAAEAKREAELDADVQKSLDEIKAGMPKFEL